MERFSYTFRSIKKNIGFDLEQRNYSADDVKALLKNAFTALDYTLLQLSNTAKLAEK